MLSITIRQADREIPISNTVPRTRFRFRRCSPLPVLETGSRCCPVVTAGTVGTADTRPPYILAIEQYVCARSVVCPTGHPI